MCDRCSGIIFTVGEFALRWSEPDLTSDRHSHENVIARLRLNDTGDERFYRWECPAPDFDRVVLDETDERAVAWWAEHEHEIAPRIIALARQIEAVYGEHLARRDALYAEYNALLAEYRAKRDVLYAEYDALHAEYRSALARIEGYVAAA